MWFGPDTYKPSRWKASSSPKVIYVAHIPTMFAKHNDLLICCLTSTVNIEGHVGTVS